MVAKLIDLKVKGIIAVSGGVIYTNKPPITDIRGRVPSRFSPGIQEEKLIFLERGGYVVEFEEDFSDKIVKSLKWDLIQRNLFMSSMSLTVSINPFIGYLLVGAPSSIEVGATLAFLQIYEEDAQPSKKAKK